MKEIKKKRAWQEVSLAKARERVSGDNTFSGWGMASNGNTWQSAPESAKQDLCRRLAAVSTKGNSASFFYDALNAFYNDASTRSTTLNDAAVMIEAASNSLPANKRGYK